MFRFTLRGLAIYIAFVALTLALTRVSFFPGTMILLLGSNLAKTLIPLRTWKFAFLGGVGTALVACFLMDRFIHIKYANPPSPYLKDGWYEYWEHAEPIANQVGALIGSTVGLLLERRATR